MTPILSAALMLLTEAPQLVNGAKSLWAAFAVLHNAGLNTLTEDQIKAMNAQGVTLDTDIAALQAAAGPKPV